MSRGKQLLPPLQQGSVSQRSRVDSLTLLHTHLPNSSHVSWCNTVASKHSAQGISQQAGQAALTFFSCSFSSMYFLAASLALSACFLKASLEASRVACWEIRVTRRLSRLQLFTKEGRREKKNARAGRQLLLDAPHPSLPPAWTCPLELPAASKKLPTWPWPVKREGWSPGAACHHHSKAATLGSGR